MTSARHPASPPTREPGTRDASNFISPTRTAADRERSRGFSSDSPTPCLRCRVLRTDARFSVRGLGGRRPRTRTSDTVARRARRSFAHRRVDLWRRAREFSLRHALRQIPRAGDLVDAFQGFRKPGLALLREWHVRERAARPRWASSLILPSRPSWVCRGCAARSPLRLQFAPRRSADVAKSSQQRRSPPRDRAWCA